MAPAHPRTSPQRTALLGLVLSVSLSSASAAPAQNPPPALICHTANQDDCYPRHFQAKDEFQIVHDDQDLPPGLHVRINMQTGKKEAKINVPGDVDPALDGLPVDDASIVVVPHQDQDENPLRLPKGAPSYDPVGKVKEPEQEAESFVTAMNMLRRGKVRHGHTFAEHLEDLEELSHDIYYGMKIAEDIDVVKALFCLMVSAPKGPPPTIDASPASRDQQAASVLAGALQNNPSALEKVAGAWPELMDGNCPDTGAATIGDALYSSLAPSHNVDAAGDSKQSASRVKAKVSVINGLLKNGTIRGEFLSRGGMDHLLEVLVSEGRDWAAAQRKAGQLVLDNFLDGDMGATLGLWPRVPRLSDEQCRSETYKAAEGCWDYHVARIMGENRAEQGHWSMDLDAKLVVARGGDPAAQADGSRRAEL